MKMSHLDAAEVLEAALEECSTRAAKMVINSMRTGASEEQLAFVFEAACRSYATESTTLLVAFTLAKESSLG